MHFDILAPDEISDLETIYAFGKDYLKSKNEENSLLTAQECNFCHIAKATEEIVASVEQKGYFIIENGRMLKKSHHQTQKFHILYFGCETLIFYRQIKFICPTLSKNN